MVKSFRNLRAHFGGKPDIAASSNDKPLYRHSMYMQSKDMDWITRNTKQYGGSNGPAADGDMDD